MKMEYSRTKEFQRDLKKLEKKFRTLKGDILTAQKSAIELFHLHNLNNGGIFEITGVGSNEDIRFYILKKFACKSLKGRGSNSGIRITYAYIFKDNRVVYIEIYFKGNKEVEDKERIIKVREEIERGL
jgi:mRNA-degrading endonuclease RelE of RelBE toxin-antitoxin system